MDNWSFDANGSPIDNNRRRVAVRAILEKTNISAWARKYWNGVLKKI